MYKTMLALVVAAGASLPLLATSTPAAAASAHNLQYGTHTKNSHDTRRSARMKQMHMRMQMRHHRRYY